jgi:hypothetical protein
MILNYFELTHGLFRRGAWTISDNWEIERDDLKVVTSHWPIFSNASLAAKCALSLIDKMDAKAAQIAKHWARFQCRDEAKAVWHVVLDGGMNARVLARIPERCAKVLFSTVSHSVACSIAEQCEVQRELVMTGEQARWEELKREDPFKFRLLTGFPAKRVKVIKPIELSIDYDA